MITKNLKTFMDFRVMNLMTLQGILFHFKKDSSWIFAVFHILRVKKNN